MKPWWECKGGLTPPQLDYLPSWIRVRMYHMVAPPHLSMATQADERGVPIPLGIMAHKLRESGWYVPERVRWFMVLMEDVHSPSGLVWSLPDDTLFALAC